MYYRTQKKLPNIMVTSLKLGTIGTETGKVCPMGYYLHQNVCYKNCPEGYVGKGSTCQKATCPPETVDNGDYCELKSHDRKSATNTQCPAGQFSHEGNCYEDCPAGFVAKGNVCEHVCPVGFEDNGGTCLKKITEGANVTNPSCSSEEYMHEGKCYPKCKPGYFAEGAVCKQGPCPVNTKDAGPTCTKSSSGRGVGTLPTCKPGQYQSGALCYPSCRAGYKGVGPVCWKDPCPPGTKDDGISCTKESYGRGAGRVPTSCDGTLDAGLCYPNCRAGYNGVGPVCWGNCPGGFNDMGVSCTKPGSYGRGAGYG